MALARINYTADGEYVDKQLKEFTLTQEVIEKLDSIEPGAERNFIQGIKVNGEQQIPDEFRVVNINVPEVIDSLASTDIRAALSAKQGKILLDYIKNLQALGHFLSNWNATTGMPTTNPQEMPYTYNAGDYYIISIIGATNYRPEGNVYAGGASSTLETEELQVGDLYMYDGTEWLFLLNNERKVPIDTALSVTSTNPVENRVVTEALNTKQPVLTAGDNIDITNDIISATDTTYGNLPAEEGGTDDSLVSTGDKYIWNNKQDGLEAGTNIQINGNVISATDTVYGAGDNIQINNNIISATDTTYTAQDFDIKDLADSTGLRDEWSGKQDTINDLQTIRDNALAGKSASDTIATYGDTVTHNVDEFATASQGAKADTAIQPGDNVGELANDVGYITSDYHDGTKQDKLTAGNNIQIANNVISATDTTYTAGTGIDITNGVISNTQTSAEWGNITGTLSSQTDLQNALDTKLNVSEYNTKTFIIASESDLATAQEVVDWYNAGNNPIVIYSGMAFNLKSVSLTGLEFYTGGSNGNTSTYTSIINYNLTIETTSGEATGINYAYSTTQVLATNINYSNPYVPSTNGQPASKKYVDDSISTATSGAVSDEVYGSTWNGVTGIAPSKNAVYNKLDAMDTAIANKANPSDIPTNISELNNDTGYITSEALPTVNNGTLTIQKNGTNVATFTANQSGNSVANLVIPTLASDVNALPDTTKYGASLSLTMNSSTYVVTAQLKDQNGNNLGTAQTIDLPIESVVVSGSYDSTTKKVVLELENGSTIEFSIADLVSGLQNEITSTNKLPSDLVDDTNQAHKFVSTTEKNTWNAKQDAISDLTTIRNGAALGATALQSGDDISELNNDAGYITSAALPTVNNSTITIQKNGANVDSFTTNASTGKTINIVVPTKTSDITNDSGYITSSSLPGVATSSALGTVKLGSDTKQTVAANEVSSEGSRTYAVQLNNSNQMVVNVPWNDTIQAIDSSLDTTSLNPVQNKVITTEVNKKAEMDVMTQTTYDNLPSSKLTDGVWRFITD